MAFRMPSSFFQVSPWRQRGLRPPLGLIGGAIFGPKPDAPTVQRPWHSPLAWLKNLRVEAAMLVDLLASEVRRYDLGDGRGLGAKEERERSKEAS